MTGSEKYSQRGDGHQPVSTQRKTERSSTVCEELKKVTDDGDRPTPGQSAGAPAYRRHGWENAEIPQPDRQHWTCPAAQTAGETALETGHVQRASGCRNGKPGHPDSLPLSHAQQTYVREFTPDDSRPRTHNACANTFITECKKREGKTGK